MRRYILPILLALSAAGCTSQGYMGNRIRDAADVFTCTVGDGYGAKARAGPIQGGLFWNRDRAGLRLGKVFRRSDDRDEFLCVFPTDMVDFETSLPVVPMEFGFFHGLDYCEIYDFPDARRKDYHAVGWLVPFVTISGRLHYYTQLEAAFGLHQTVRIGVNPGEFLDFVLGWTTLDVFRDDSVPKEAASKRPR